MDIFNLLLSTKGRINREDFWIGTLLITVINLVMMIVARLSDSAAALAIVVVFSLLSVWPSLAIQIKRWHDVDKSGWWMLVNLVPFGSLYALYQCGFVKGTEGPNQYGPDPMAGQE